MVWFIIFFSLRWSSVSLASIPAPYSTHVRCGSSKFREVSRDGPAWSVTPRRAFAQSPVQVSPHGYGWARLVLLLLLIKAGLIALLFAEHPAWSCWSCSASLGLCSRHLALLIHRVPSHAGRSFPSHWDSCYKIILTKDLSTGGRGNFLFLWSGPLQKKPIVTHVWTFKTLQLNWAGFSCWSARWHQTTESLLKDNHSCMFQNWLRLILKKALLQMVLHVCCPWGVIFSLIEINSIKLFFSS